MKLKTIDDSTAAPDKPRAVRRQADHSIFANGDSGILLYFENPTVLSFLREATGAVLQPSNDFERLFTEYLVRNFWRTMRLGNLETAAIDVEMSEHREAAESRWDKLDPESLYHVATRDPATRAAIREYSTLEGTAIRRFKDAFGLLKIMKTY